MRTFDREVWLTLTVNIVPIGIIAVLLVGLLFGTAFAPNPFVSLITLGLLLVPILVLAFVTYLAASTIEFEP